MALVWITLFFLLVPLSVNGIRCFSTHCPRGTDLCIQLCPVSSQTCNAFRQTRLNNNHQAIELGCTNSTCTSSACNFTRLPISNTLYYCCCTDDLCNTVRGVTDIIDPTLGISTQLPPNPVPVRPSGKYSDVRYCLISLFVLLLSLVIIRHTNMWKVLLLSGQTVMLPWLRSVLWNFGWTSDQRYWSFLYLYVSCASCHIQAGVAIQRMSIFTSD